MMPDRDVERQDTHIATGYIVYIGVEESQNEAVVLDIRVHHPSLAVSVVKVNGRGRLRKRIQHDRKYAVYFDQVDSDHELSATL